MKYVNGRFALQLNDFIKALTNNLTPLLVLDVSLPLEPPYSTIMKKSIYIIVLLSLALFNCQRTELDDELSFNTSDKDISIEQADSPSYNSRNLLEPCVKSWFFNAEGQRVGWIAFSILEKEIEIEYVTRANLNILETNFNFKNCYSQTFFAQEADPGEFKYNYKYEGFVTRTSHMVDKADGDAISCYAARMVAQDSEGELHELWANQWATYAQADFSDCGTWPEDYEFCDDKEKKVYICHNGKTICVSINAIDAHLAHGDELGQCD